MNPSITIKGVLIWTSHMDLAQDTPKKKHYVVYLSHDPPFHDSCPIHVSKILPMN
jgi:hypothetical protein